MTGPAARDPERPRGRADAAREAGKRYYDSLNA